MRNLLLLILIITWAGNAKAQTDSLEKAALYRMVMTEKIKPEQYSALAKKWNATIEKIVKYPEMPLDKDSLVHYTYVSDFGSVDKNTLFSRTQEWLAISQGLVPSALYANRADGRIIFDHGFKINDTYTGYYTCIITVMDEKVVMEFINLSYQAFYPGYVKAEQWSPDRTESILIDEMIPVVTRDSYKWNTYLGLMGMTNEKIFEVVAQLRDYQLKFDERYPL